MRLPTLGRRLKADDSGQDLIEYAMVATFISLLAMIAAFTLNSATASLYGATGRGVGKGANFATSGGSTGTTTSPCNNGQASSSESPCK